VTPRRWQDVWLSEGFASYWAPLYLRESSGDSLFRVRMNEIRNEIIASPVVATRPVVDTVGAATPNTMLNVNSYQKGAFVLHMLRAEVGDSVFFDGIRDYQRTFHNGTATTENLRAAIEKRAGASLQMFFDQWLHRPGYAELAVTWSYDSAKRIANFTVVQGEKFPPFAVALVLALRDADGKEERHTLHLDATQLQTVPVSIAGIGAPTAVVLDPDVQLLARLTLSATK
jgi:aminopeptidase N